MSEADETIEGDFPYSKRKFKNGDVCPWDRKQVFWGYRESGEWWMSWDCYWQMAERHKGLVKTKSKANARSSARLYPLWLGILGFLTGIGFALHLLAVTLATTFQPLIAGGIWDWALHIPKLPAPLDGSEINFVAFFFGGLGVMSIAGAIAKRK